MMKLIDTAGNTVIINTFGRGIERIKSRRYIFRAVPQPLRRYIASVVTEGKTPVYRVRFAHKLTGDEIALFSTDPRWSVYTWGGTYPVWEAYLKKEGTR